MIYQIEFSPAADRQFRKLIRSVQQRLRVAIDALARDPRPHGSRMLEGSRDVYRIRVGDYRVVYRVEDKRLLVLILKVGDRKDIYRGP